MNKLLTLLTLVIWGTTYTAHATVVWSDDFTYPDGAVPGTSNVGSGTFDTSGNVAIVNNAVVLTADGGNDRVEFESTAGALAGNFTFDISITGGTTDQVFVQMVDGTVRSTGAAPIPNFVNTIDVSNHSIANPSTVNYFFNVTGSTLNYTGPDGSAQTLNNNAYAYWVDNTRIAANNTASNHGAGFPTNVDSLIFQTFAGQTGEVITIDNASLRIIPEPCSIFSLLIFGFGAFALHRRRRLIR